MVIYSRQNVVRRKGVYWRESIHSKGMIHFDEFVVKCNEMDINSQSHPTCLFYVFL